jgi:NAD(P)-dependent dehydrogenase (short-subunit alcohol dehydrogenase family)
VSDDSTSLPPPISDWANLLAGRVAVVTGGAGGIGGAISHLFAQHGAIVELADIDEDSATATVEGIGAAGGVATAHHVDVCDSDAVAALASSVLDRHGTVDVLVNNVGEYRPLVRFENSSPEDWETILALNLGHVLTVTRAFLPTMRTQHSGSVVNVHSVEAMRGYPGDPVYAAAKAAVAQLTSSMAVRYGRDGIRFNGIGPDLTQTPQVDYLAGYEPDELNWESWAPVGRLGQPEDQARVALFLASDLAAFVTGHNIPVDGGSLAGGGWFFSPAERRFVNRPRGL